MGLGKMSQWVKVLADKLNDPSLLSGGTHSHKSSVLCTSIPPSQINKRKNPAVQGFHPSTEEAEPHGSR